MIRSIEQLNQEFQHQIMTKDRAAKLSVLRDENIEENKHIAKQNSSVQQEIPLWKEFFFLALKIATIVLVSMLLFTFLFGVARYNDPSMSPSIRDGDLVIFHRYNGVGYLPQDTVVLRHNGKIQVRRVVAVAGDTVDITESGLIINGSTQQESYVYQRTERYEDGISFPITLEDGQVFVLADSRIGATDSRIYGPVEIEDTFGKVMAIMRRRSF